MAASTANNDTASFLRFFSSLKERERKKQCLGELLLCLREREILLFPLFLKSFSSLFRKEEGRERSCECDGESVELRPHCVPSPSAPRRFEMFLSANYSATQDTRPAGAGEQREDNAAGIRLY